ncbi:unnamed protein product [Heterobilharzia americana]|nr:unnamed protein product [Heterobilharzia americana]
MVILICFPKTLTWFSRRTFSTSGINYSPRNAFSDYAYKKRTLLNYTVSFGIFMAGVGYGTVPLYRIYCSKTGSGTNSSFAMAKREKIKTMKPVRDRDFIVYFSADTHSLMNWKFKPSQTALRVVLVKLHWHSSQLRIQLINQLSELPPIRLFQLKHQSIFTKYNVFASKNNV